MPVWVDLTFSPIVVGKELWRELIKWGGVARQWEGELQSPRRIAAYRYSGLYGFPQEVG